MCWHIPQRIMSDVRRIKVSTVWVASGGRRPGLTQYNSHLTTAFITNLTSYTRNYFVIIWFLKSILLEWQSIRMQTEKLLICLHMSDMILMSIFLLFILITLDQSFFPAIFLLFGRKYIFYSISYFPQMNFWVNVPSRNKNSFSTYRCETSFRFCKCFYHLRDKLLFIIVL